MPRDPADSLGGPGLEIDNAYVAPAEEDREFKGPFQEVAPSALHRYEGTVNQVLGDGIVALFGAPLAHEDHAVRACDLQEAKALLTALA